MSAISPDELPKKSATISGRTMTYSEMGTGDPIIFLHGNPTSSYLWRNVMPHLKDQGRCIAPDLIGMGDSDKLEPSGPERYTFREHRRFLDSFLETMGVEKNVTLVIHDWGSALGFDWANRNRTKVKGIAYMEGIVRPMTWNEWSPAARRIFEGFRSDEGEAMILEKNLFIEAVLPGSILRKLSDAEMNVYRRPFKEAGDPGAILVGAQREFCRSWKNQTELTVRGNHFLQEDSPHEIGEAVATWRKAWA